MNPYNIDVAVAMIFFNRADTLEKVFEQVRIARPSKLFLIQDGPRKGNKNDIEGIKACREVFEGKIDWECEVYKDYSEENLGCGMRVYSGIKNAFEKVDKLIILEDDCVPGQSMFPFCKEVLDKYADDKRICSISGMNHMEKYDSNGCDYFFCSTGTIWGWATWKRVIDQWDPKYRFLDDKYVIKNMYDEFGATFMNAFIRTCKTHLSSGREHYESILGSFAKYNYGINIIPTKNMTCNIGVDAETTHSVADIAKLPRATRKMLYMETYELEFPLKHPHYIQADYGYWEKVLKRMNGNWFIRTFKIRRFEAKLYSIFPFLGK